MGSEGMEAQVKAKDGDRRQGKIERRWEEHGWSGPTTGSLLHS